MHVGVVLGRSIGWLYEAIGFSNNRTHHDSVHAALQGLFKECRTPPDQCSHGLAGLREHLHLALPAPTILDDKCHTFDIWRHKTPRPSAATESARRIAVSASGIIHGGVKRFWREEDGARRPECISIESSLPVRAGRPFQLSQGDFQAIDFSECWAIGIVQSARADLSCSLYPWQCAAARTSIRRHRATTTSRFFQPETQ